MRSVFRIKKKNWTFLGPEDEKKWYGKSNVLLKENGKFRSFTDGAARFKETSHPVFTSASALSPWNY